jgi:Ca2+-binding RTX toxin-like protein
MLSVALVSAIALMLGMLGVSASAGARARCFGERATIVGTSGADVLVGTGRGDVIAALGGDDRIRGAGRNDLICAGDGNDVVRGGDGIDLTFGGDGNDRIFGNRGPFNQAVPGAGNDFVNGGPGGGDEVIYLDAPEGVVGNLGAGTVRGHGRDEIVKIEWLIGSDHDDTLIGTQRGDVLYGADGDDTIDALGGANFMAGGAGDDHVTGGDGFDLLGNYFLTIYYMDPPPAGPITVDLIAGTLTGDGSDTLIGIDGSQGSTGDDVMIGNAADNEFTNLFEGADTVDAGAGDDVVDGGQGADDLDGGLGTDLLGNLDAPEGMTINLSTQTDSHGDVFTGFEDVWGTFFDDVITGNDGPNEILGIDGADQLNGLGGNDLLIGGFFGFADPDEDTADGGLGTDACDAETEIACEGDPPVELGIRSTLRTLPARTAVGARYDAGWR